MPPLRRDMAAECRRYDFAAFFQWPLTVTPANVTRRWFDETDLQIFDCADMLFRISFMFD